MAQKFLTDIEVTRGLVDSDGDLGVAGQVLSSTGTGTNWITNEANSTVVYQDGFTGDNSTVDFTLSVSVTDENVTQVYIDGVYQTKDTYSVSNTTLTFSTAPPLNADIEVITFSTATTADDLQAGVMIIPVKNTHTASIAKGEPVYITGNVGSSARLQIAPADASNSAKMPAAGLLLQTLAVNAEGYVVTGGYLRNLTTDTIDGTSTSSNDTVYVKSGGGLTMTKPTGTNLIQNIAKVARVASGNAGSLLVSSILRTNDVPNITNDYFWLGNSSGVATPTEFTSSVRGLISVSGNALSYNSSTGVITSNYEESPTFTGNVTINGSFTSQGIDDNADATAITINGNEEVGIGTTSPFAKLHVETTASQIARFSYNSTNYQDLTYEGSNIVGGSHVFKIAGSEKMRITTGGELQLGTGAYTSIQFDPDPASHSGNGGLNIEPLTSPGSGTANWYTRFKNRVGGGTTNHNVTIDGIVGIGTTSPAKQLTLSAAIPFIRLQETGAGSKRLDLWVDSNAVAHIDANQSAQQITFRTASTDRLRIANNGNVGIGTTSPSSLLHLYKSSGDAMLNIQAVSAGDPGITFTSINNRTGNIFYSDGSTNAKLTYDHNDVSFKLYAHNTTVADFVLNETTAYFPTQNVGIGTTSPQALFHVHGSDTTYTNYNTVFLGTTAGGSVSESGISLMTSGDALAGFVGSNLRIDGSTYSQTNASRSSGYITFANTTTAGRTSYIIFGGTVKGSATLTERMRINDNGYVGIGTSSPADKLEVSSGNIRITNNSPMLRFRDSDVTNLEHRILGGGNQGLEYAADVNNVTAGYHRWDIANSEKMRLIENGNLGIGTTSPDGKLDVRGAISSGSALEDTDVSLTSNGGTAQATGILEISQGWSASTSNGDTIVFRHNSTSWKSWILHYNFASTNGMTIGVIGGYWNNSGSTTSNTSINNLGMSAAVTYGGTGNQNIIVTFTFTSLGTHPLSSFKYIQHGGDGKPLASKTSITLNS